MKRRGHRQVAAVESVGELAVVLEQLLGDARYLYFFSLTFHR
jgi:hypothetical protein